MERERKSLSEAVLLGDQISIIIPAYNEEAGIANILRSLFDEQRLSGAEIFVVDDGSTDATFEIANRFPGVTVLQHPFNRGYGSAIITAARLAQREFIIWFDSDGQHRVEDLVAVAEKLVKDNLEYCIGVRDENSFHDPNRRLGKWILKMSVSFSLGRKAPDFNSGLRGFKRQVLLRYLHLLPARFGASTLTTLLMIEGNHHGATVPIVVNRRIGTSSVKQFRDGMRTLEIILHIFLLFKPLKFFGTIGAGLILAGLVYGFIKAHLVGLGFPVLAALAVILGVQAFFFGLICDQISAIRREKFF